MKRIYEEPLEMTMATEQKILSHRLDCLEKRVAKGEKCINELKEYVKSLMGDVVFLIGLVQNMKAQIKKLST